MRQIGPGVSKSPSNERLRLHTPAVWLVSSENWLMNATPSRSHASKYLTLLRTQRYYKLILTGQTRAWVDAQVLCCTQHISYLQFCTNFNMQ